jgi:hypothetical protein
MIHCPCDAVDNTLLETRNDVASPFAVDTAFLVAVLFAGSTLTTLEGVPAVTAAGAGASALMASDRRPPARNSMTDNRAQDRKRHEQPVGRHRSSERVEL